MGHHYIDSDEENNAAARRGQRRSGQSSHQQQDQRQRGESSRQRGESSRQPRRESGRSRDDRREEEIRERALHLQSEEATRERRVAREDEEALRDAAPRGQRIRDWARDANAELERYQRRVDPEGRDENEGGGLTYPTEESWRQWVEQLHDMRRAGVSTDPEIRRQLDAHPLDRTTPERDQERGELCDTSSDDNEPVEEIGRGSGRRAGQSSRRRRGGGGH